MAGMRAMESLRLEKSYRMWGSDMTRDYTPFETGLDRFVRMNKGEFIGREALELKQQAAGVPIASSRSSVHGVTDADPLGNEPLFDKGGKMVGRATSALLRTRRETRASPSATCSRHSRRSAPNCRSRSSANAMQPP
jgi:dimethylglycine dehydrogenase